METYSCLKPETHVEKKGFSLQVYYRNEKKILVYSLSSCILAMM